MFYQLEREMFNLIPNSLFWCPYGLSLKITLFQLNILAQKGNRPTNLKWKRNQYLLLKPILCATCQHLLNATMSSSEVT